jgi:hypothetical protein
VRASRQPTNQPPKEKKRRHKQKSNKLTVRVKCKHISYQMMMMQHPQQELNQRAKGVRSQQNAKEEVVVRYPPPSFMSTNEPFHHELSGDDCCPLSSRNSKRRKSPPRTKGVTFGSSTTHTVLAYIESIDDMTEDEMNDRWFHPGELQETKSKAVKLCQKHYKSKKQIDKSFGSDDADADGEDESIRGMDVYFPSRQRHHKSFVQHVLEAFHVRCAGNEEHVSLLAEKWSCKSRERAIKTALQDWREVYSFSDVTVVSTATVLFSAQHSSSLSSSTSASSSSTTTSSSTSKTTSSHLIRPAPPARTGSNNLVPGQRGRRS